MPWQVMRSNIRCSPMPLVRQRFLERKRTLDAEESFLMQPLACLSLLRAKDGHHHWFTYVVNRHYATSSPGVYFPGSVSHPPSHRLCEKQDAPFLSVKSKGVSTNIAVAIISHGPQGRGAFPHPSAILAQGQDEIQNSASDTQIIDRPISQAPLNPFSHRVVWVTAKNLLALYGRSPCPPLEDYKPAPGGVRYQMPIVGGAPQAEPRKSPGVNSQAPYALPPGAPRAPGGRVAYNIPSQE